MNNQKFENDQLSYPLSTRSLQLLQEDVHNAVKAISDIVGTNVILRDSGAAYAGGASVDGLVIVGGKLLTLKGERGSGMNQKRYIQVVSTTENIVALGRTYPNARTVEYARYATTGTAVSSFVNLSVQDAKTGYTLQTLNAAMANREASLRSELLAAIAPLRSVPAGTKITWSVPEEARVDRSMYGTVYDLSVFSDGVVPVGKVLVETDRVKEFADLLRDRVVNAGGRYPMFNMLTHIARPEWTYLSVTDFIASDGYTYNPDDGQEGQPSNPFTDQLLII